MEVSNTLAYYGTETITVVESFILQVSGLITVVQKFYREGSQIGQLSMAYVNRRCDNRHNDTRHNDVQHNYKKCDTKHRNVTVSLNDTQHNNINIKCNS